MKKKKYALWLIITVCVFGCFAVYKYIYQDHRNITQEKPAFTLTSKAINEEFLNNIALSEKKYLNKVISISGKITEINSNYLTLDNTIFCQFNKSIPKHIKVNTAIYLKGRYIGYDDLLNEIKLDQSYIINENF